jgi:AraC family L-rhamnose operon regulatory protein RhaS
VHAITKYSIEAITKQHREFPFRAEHATLSEDFSRHRHDFMELVIITGGTGVHLLDTLSYPLTAGDVFAVSGDTEHGFQNPRSLSLINIMFDPLRFTPERIKLETMPGYQALFCAEPGWRRGEYILPQLSLDAAQLAAVEGLASLLIREYRTGPRRLWLLRNVLLTLCSYLSVRYETSAGESPAGPVYALGRACAFIRSSYAGALILEDIAGFAGVSLRHLNRLFKKTYGTSPWQYLLEIRLDAAKNLLLTTELPIGRIALECGFSDPNYFSRCFSRRNGASPRTFRKSIA